MSKPEIDDEQLCHCMLLLFGEGLNATKATEAINKIYPLLTIDELSQKLRSSWFTVQFYLKLIGKVNRMGIWMPHELSPANKEARVNTCSSLLSRQRIHPFLQQLVTGDEKWIVYENVSRKKQWLSKNQTPIPTPKPGLTLRKVLLCIWWDIRGIIHFELLKPGETITSEVYCRQLERLDLKLKEKRPSLVNRRGVILHQDNARPHTARLTREKIQELNWEVIPHPPYSPDLAPSDYHLFRSMEHSLRNKKFRNVNEVENHLINYFNSKPQSFYKRGIENLQNKWEEVLNNNGNYIL